MDIIDWLLGLLYAFVAYVVVKNKAQANASGSLYKDYYIRGFFFKLLGVFAFASIYLFYYKGGDGINFYYATKPLYKLFFDEPSAVLTFVFSNKAAYPYQGLYEANSYNVMFLLRGSASLTTIKIGTILGLFCFNYYLPLCVVFAYVSYQFQWKIFHLISSVYPQLRKQMFYAFLMIPSVAFWGSTFTKDTITLSCIFLLIYSFYYVFILKKRIWKNFIYFLLAAYILSLIRGFILFSTVPCLILMAVVYYQGAIKSTVLRYILGPFLLLSGVVGAFLVFNSLGNSVESYSVDSLQQKAEGFRSWHTTQGGATYSLAEEMEYTPLGILKQAPFAITITLFGPFIWQISSPVMLMSGIESAVLLYLFTTKVFFNRRLYGLLPVLFKDHLIVFCVPFIFILATAIGLTSFNYGALVRYRIPILPFFVVLFYLVNYHLAGKSAAWVRKPTKVN